MNKPSPTCCNEYATWVDNVPGKEYWYCRVCKKEVDKDELGPFYGFYKPYGLISKIHMRRLKELYE